MQGTNDMKCNYIFAGQLKETELCSSWLPSFGLVSSVCMLVVSQMAHGLIIISLIAFRILMNEKSRKNLTHADA